LEHALDRDSAAATSAGGGGRERPSRARNGDDLGDLATANGLSGDGVVISVWLYPRGAGDSGYPARSLPLQLSGATLSNGFEGVSEDIANERLVARVGDWDAEVHAWFGTNPPTQAQLRAAQEELNRLVIPTS
jgi:hypothetical protein